MKICSIASFIPCKCLSDVNSTCDQLMLWKKNKTLAVGCVCCDCVLLLAAVVEQTDTQKRLWTKVHYRFFNKRVFIPNEVISACHSTKVRCIHFYWTEYTLLLDFSNKQAKSSFADWNPKNSWRHQIFWWLICGLRVTILRNWIDQVSPCLFQNHFFTPDFIYHTGYITYCFFFHFCERNYNSLQICMLCCATMRMKIPECANSLSAVRLQKTKIFLNHGSRIWFCLDGNRTSLLLKSSLRSCYKEWSCWKRLRN